MSREDEPLDSVNSPKAIDFDLGPALAGTASGVLSAALCLLGPVAAPRDPELRVIVLQVIALTPGVSFGVAAMTPFREVLDYWWPKAIAAVLLCAVAHEVALAIASPRSAGSSAAAGAIGSLIAGKGLLVVIGHPWRYRVLAAMVAAGALVGPAFSFINIFAYIPWQLLVAAPLGSLLTEVRAARRENVTGEGPRIDTVG